MRAVRLMTCLWSATASLAWSQTIDPDLWPVMPGDPIETYLDRTLFHKGRTPAGIEAVLDRRADMAVVNVSHVEGLVDGSSHVLDFKAGQAYHIRPSHVLASARLAPASPPSSPRRTLTHSSSMTSPRAKACAWRVYAPWRGPSNG